MLAALDFAQSHIRQSSTCSVSCVPSLPSPSARSSPRSTRPSCAARSKRLPGPVARRAQDSWQGDAAGRNRSAVTEANGALKERFAEQEIYIGRILHDIERDEMRTMVLDKGVRADGRA